MIYKPGDEVPLDVTEAFIKSLETLMLAQAQECIWQKAVMDGMSSNDT
jgi:programmed cell death 6-interacting protein